MALSFDLDRVVKTCTIDNSLLDLVFIAHTITNLGYDCGILGDIFYHNAVLVSLKIRIKYWNPKFVTLLDFSGADDVSILYELSFYFDDFFTIILEANVNTLVIYINTRVGKCTNKFAPVTRKISKKKTCALLDYEKCATVNWDNEEATSYNKT